MLYAHGTVITVNKSREIILDGAVLVEGNRIADVGKAEALRAKYPRAGVVDLAGRVVIPGLISTHMHTAQTLLRGSFSSFSLLSLTRSTVPTPLRPPFPLFNFYIYFFFFKFMV